MWPLGSLLPGLRVITPPAGSLLLAFQPICLSSMELIEPWWPEPSCTNTARLALTLSSSSLVGWRFSASCSAR